MRICTEMLVACVALVAGAVQVRADPSPVVEKLINDPVSMLDWGLDHLWEDLHDHFRPPASMGPITGGDVSLFVRYKFETNQIEISVLVGGLRVAYEGTAKEACTKALNAIRGTMSLWNGPGKSDFLFPWTAYFSHEGFTRDRAASEKELNDALPKLVTIRVDLFLPVRLTCFGPLIGDSIAYEEP